MLCAVTTQSFKGEGEGLKMEINPLLAIVTTPTKD